MKRIWNLARNVLFAIAAFAEAAFWTLFNPRRLHNPEEGICIGYRDGRDAA